MAKPSRLPFWATDGGALVDDPGLVKQAQGWAGDEIPPANYFNWFKNLVGQWVTYLDGAVDLVASQKLAYDAIVGAEGSHATIQAALDAVPNGSRILVADSQIIATTILIDGKIDVVIEIKPGKTITTVTALATAFNILNSNRIQVLGGRLFGFVTGFNIQATCKNLVLERIYFGSISGDEVVDNGQNSTINTISEVA